jgi:four helix bundle protein
MSQNIKSFEGLEVWQLARKIRNEIFELVKSLPAEEKYRLSDQMVRSSRSIGDNISEGYGRYHFQENIQYCRQARGSAYELINHIITAHDCDYITQQAMINHRKQIIRCIKIINGYISFLNKQKSDSVKESEVDYRNDD